MLGDDGDDISIPTHTQISNPVYLQRFIDFRGVDALCTDVLVPAAKAARKGANLRNDTGSISEGLNTKHANELEVCILFVCVFAGVGEQMYGWVCWIACSFVCVGGTYVCLSIYLSVSVCGRVCGRVCVCLCLCVQEVLRFVQGNRERLMYESTSVAHVNVNCEADFKSVRCVR